MNIKSKIAQSLKTFGQKISQNNQSIKKKATAWAEKIRDKFASIRSGKSVSARATQPRNTSLSLPEGKALFQRSASSEKITTLPLVYAASIDVKLPEGEAAIDFKKAKKYLTLAEKSGPLAALSRAIKDNNLNAMDAVIEMKMPKTENSEANKDRENLLRDALSLAIQFRNIGLVKNLIENHKAPTDAKSFTFQRTPTGISGKSEKTTVFEPSPFAQAAGLGNLPVVNYFIEKNLLDFSGQDKLALNYALKDQAPRETKKEIVTLLLKSGSPVTATGLGNDRSPLKMSYQRGFDEGLAKLIQDRASEEGKTAAQNG